MKKIQMKTYEKSIGHKNLYTKSTKIYKQKEKQQHKTHKNKTKEENKNIQKTEEI